MGFGGKVIAVSRGCIRFRLIVGGEQPYWVHSAAAAPSQWKFGRGCVCVVRYYVRVDRFW